VEASTFTIFIYFQAFKVLIGCYRVADSFEMTNEIHFPRRKYNLRIRRVWVEVVDLFSSCYKWYAASAHPVFLIAIHPVVTMSADLLTRNLLDHFTSKRVGTQPASCSSSSNGGNHLA
jgi:hypothetical protein